LSYLHIVNHPLAGDCLRILRNRETGVRDFRDAMNKLGLIMAVEATGNLKYTVETVVTPLDTGADCPHVRDSKILLVPVLRAGLGFLDSFLEILPAARVAHIGISRDHDTLEARAYLDTVPDDAGDFDHVYILDPMLATGNSSVKTLELITGKGYDPARITLVCAVAVKRGVEQVHGKFPAVRIITAVLDPALNDKAYIVPGLGDAGDRLYLI
jgi:uracil phosphoribosyltransferase